MLRALSLFVVGVCATVLVDLPALRNHQSKSR